MVVTSNARDTRTTHTNEIYTSKYQFNLGNAVNGQQYRFVTRRHSASSLPSLRTCSSSQGLTRCHHAASSNSGMVCSYSGQSVCTTRRVRRKTLSMLQMIRRIARSRISVAHAWYCSPVRLTKYSLSDTFRYHRLINRIITHNMPWTLTDSDSSLTCT